MEGAVKAGRSAKTLTFVALVLAAVLVFGLAGCGKRGPIVPAWTAKKARPPRAVKDLATEVRFGRVWLTFTEPTENKDGSSPINLDRYVVFYEVFPLGKKYCLTCPLDLSRKLEFEPNDPGEARFESGRVEVPIVEYDSSKKYVFTILAVSPEGRWMGGDKPTTFNWPH